VLAGINRFQNHEEAPVVAGYPENPEKERRKQRKLKTILLIG